MDKSYLISVTLLITHQIDAAYWHEWTMFMLPGGIQLFLAFNMLAFPWLLLGYKHVVLNTALAHRYSYLCASLGILTFVIHSIFFALDYDQFSLPLSTAIIGLCFLSSIVLLHQTKQTPTSKNLPLGDNPQPI